MFEFKKIENTKNTHLLKDINIYIQRIKTTEKDIEKMRVIRMFCKKYGDKPMAIELMKIYLVKQKIQHPMFSYNYNKKKILFDR
ncbi:hypothetical protein [Tepidibacter aestuarii]|uniref:hypothetical protein n=1 Tax=Tepidibacter aestuarii TaxID=2925782 RepID=UPI0020C0392B|nr:hypothetical protein [Tepidibacter aestuarii]CAH2213812.1 protein of unknown function [Tepidibacter aestuarii]